MSTSPETTNVTALLSSLPHTNVEISSSRVSSTEEGGRTLIATRDLSVGATVLDEPPFVCLTTDRTVCDCCFAHCDEPKQCSACKTVSYCSVACRNTSWRVRGHKHECAALKCVREALIAQTRSERDAAQKGTPNQSAGVMSEWAALCLRIVRTIKDAEESSLCSRQWHVFQSLMTHNDTLDDSQKAFYAQCSVALLETVCELRSHFDPQSLSHLLARLCVNMYHITDDELRVTGQGVYPAASLFNHSCEPNCCVVFNYRDMGEPPRLVVRAVRPIAQGEELFISYCDVVSAYTHRQSFLRKRYFFTCECVRCVCERERGEVWLCEKCGKTLVCSDKTYKCENNKCTLCGNTQTPIERQRVIDHTLSRVCAQPTSDVLGRLRELLVLQRGLTGPSSVHLAPIQRELIDQLTYAQEWEGLYTVALEHTLLCEKTLDSPHPTVAVGYTRVGKVAAVLQGEGAESLPMNAMSAYRKALSVAMLTFGPEHRFASIIRQLLAQEVSIAHAEAQGGAAQILE